MGNREIEALKRQVAELQARLNKIEGNNGRDYLGELELSIARALGFDLEEFEGEDTVGNMVYRHLPEILNPEIASYIAGFHVGVSLVEGSMTGIVDESSDFYESFAHYFEKVGFDNFQLGFSIPYYDQNHYLCFDRLVEKFIETPMNKSTELRQIMAKLENFGIRQPTREEVLDIVEKYVYLVSSKFVK